MTGRAPGRMIRRGICMYNVRSLDSNEFIDHAEILESLDEGRKLSSDRAEVARILNKAREYRGLTHREAAALLFVEDEDTLKSIYALAREIKEHIYGRRIVMFAPLYLSDYCVNNCRYCGFHASNKTVRRKLSQEELREEVLALEALGHKRLLLEAGEDDRNCPLDYVIECMHTIYATKLRNGSIRRVNVDIAATTAENYRRLKDAGLGTYILFQETYHKPTYEFMHMGGPKANYEWHTEAMDRGMLEGGLDDVGIGVLFGLYDWRYEVMGLLMHAEHLEAVAGVGPHTISFPRLLPAEGVDYSAYSLVSDDDFKHLIAVTRLAVPYTGMILTTRESAEFRRGLLDIGMSQMSAGSCVGVGGYAHPQRVVPGEAPQFHLADERKPEDVLKGLVRDGYLPSFCTACYRSGRTGDRFMPLAKSGEISNCCQPNAMLTFKEYLLDYADDELRALGENMIADELSRISREPRRNQTAQYLKRLEQGERDLRF